MKRGRWAGWVGVVVACALLIPASGRAEVIDRILAVVDRELITLTDVVAALRLGFVPPAPPGADAVRVALDALIARQIELGEANRYQPPEPPQEQIDARLDAARARFRTPAELNQLFVETGLSEEQLRLRLRDDLRIEAYLNQRFGAARQPSDQDISEYYRAHPAEFSDATGARPLSEVRDAVQSRLVAAQRATLVTDWLDGIRRRTEIADLYVSPK